MVKKLPNIRALDGHLQKHPNNQVNNYIYNYLVVILYMLKSLDTDDEWQSSTMKLISRIEEKHLAQMGLPSEHVFQKMNMFIR